MTIASHTVWIFGIASQRGVDCCRLVGFGTLMAASVRVRCLVHANVQVQTKGLRLAGSEVATGVGGPGARGTSLVSGGAAWQGVAAAHARGSSRDLP